MYRSLVCPGKRMHEIFFQAANEGVPEMVSKYLQECELMSSLRHPNVTQFLGLCFLKGLSFLCWSWSDWRPAWMTCWKMHHATSPSQPNTLSWRTWPVDCSIPPQEKPSSHPQRPDFKECPPYLLPYGQDY